MGGGGAGDKERGEDRVDVEVAGCEEPAGAGEGRRGGQETEDGGDGGEFGRGVVGFEEGGKLSDGVDVGLVGGFGGQSGLLQ